MTFFRFPPSPLSPPLIPTARDAACGKREREREDPIRVGSKGMQVGACQEQAHPSSTGPPANDVTMSSPAPADLLVKGHKYSVYPPFSPLFPFYFPSSAASLNSVFIFPPRRELSLVSFDSAIRINPRLLQSKSWALVARHCYFCLTQQANPFLQTPFSTRAVSQRRVRSYYPTQSILLVAGRQSCA